MQNAAQRTWVGRACLTMVALLVLNVSAQTQHPISRAQEDGQHAFDWEIGTWKTQVRRLANPLSGSQEWVEYTGTSVVRKVLDGRANLVELRVEGPAGRIDGVSLRLYNPQAKQWSLNYASVRNGTLTRPVFGGFRGSRGEFYGHEDLDGRAILVRFVISEISADSARFEQAFSADGGRTWETNWIATDTRIDEANQERPWHETPSLSTSQACPAARTSASETTVRLRDKPTLDRGAPNRRSETCPHPTRFSNQ